MVGSFTGRWRQKMNGALSRQKWLAWSKGTSALPASLPCAHFQSLLTAASRWTLSVRSVLWRKTRQSLGSSLDFFAGHKSRHVRCLLHTQIAQSDFDNSLQVVLENGEAHSVIGSLDLNQGCQLPGELSGDYPEVHFAQISCQHSQRRTSCSDSQFWSASCECSCWVSILCMSWVSVSWCKSMSVGWECRAQKRLPLKCVCGAPSTQARCGCSPSAQGTGNCTILGYLSLSHYQTQLLMV